jgi:PAP2 superfamily
LSDSLTQQDDAILPEKVERAFLMKATAVLLVVVGLLTTFMVTVSGVSSRDFSPVLASFMLIALYTGLAIAAIAQVLALVTPGRWQLDMRALWLLVAMLLCGSTLPLFELFKQLILPARGFPLDPALARIDRALFFGHDAWEVSHALFGSVAATLVLDRAYSMWLVFMFPFPMVVVMAIKDVRMRARLLGTWLAAWIVIGGIGAWLFGSAGPCYYDQLVGPPGRFAGFHRAMANLTAAAGATGQSITALDFQAMLASELNHKGLVAAGGISAMPSMHVAMAVLFAIAGFARTRWLGWVFSIYALLIWIGSIHLGWHYAIDGIVGAALMLGLWRLSGKFTAQP